MKYIYSLLFGISVCLSPMSIAANTEEESKFSAEPLSETDMDQVSADAGLNILNVYGNTSAGLSVDSDETESNPSSNEQVNTSDEEEELASLADDEIVNAIDTDDTNNSISALETSPESEELISAVEETDVKVGNSEVFTTTAEIKYKSNEFNHSMKTKGDGAVTITRDLHVELLKLENLSGDHHDRSRTAGDIYLSNWRSRGDTTITPR